VAVHLACQSLRSGESTAALAAGVNVILQPSISIAYSQSGMMAPDGHCKFGDANGDGYVRSEGVGVILLKPLSAALASGDPVRAVIRGSAVNNDGRGSGHMATPSRTGQAAMLRAAYANAGMAPEQVGYVEAHGTGTRAGDPVEIGALGDVLAADRAAGSRCMVGSVKTNLGHTEGAAGMAGLIKCVLALQHGEVPGSLHLREPNPAIPWADLPFDIPQALVPWPTADGTNRVAGVSAFGITGTNAHVIVEEAPSAAVPAPATPSPDRAVPLVLSAASATALESLANSYADLLAADDGPALRDVCATAARHRAGLEHRAVLVSNDRTELVERLRRLATGDQQAADVVGRAPVDAPRQIAFVFPGQGGQWHGMARELLATEPAFAAAIDACDAALPSGTSWTVRGQLQAEPGGSDHRLDEIAVIQPTLLAVEIALAAMWRSWGVEPDAVIGHSMGEVGAAHLAGALSLSDAMRVICTRSELLQRTSGAGAMALLDVTVDEAASRIASFDGRIVVAVSNGPRSTVVSGDPDAVAEVLAQCERDGIFGRAVKVDVASHSAQMDPLVPELVASLTGLEPHDTGTRLYSTVEAAARPGDRWDATYWGRNMREPVLFGATVESMLADGVDTFVELSPHPTLLPSLTQVAGPTTHPPLAVGSLRRGEPERAAMLGALGALWAAGHTVDWERQFPSGTYARVQLPLYPWQ
ncbi:MAG: type I polyketide synthase, partial [Ilumatobacteraceae bacterium]